MSQSTCKSNGTNPSDDDSSCSNGDREAGWGFLLGGLSGEAMAGADWEVGKEVQKSNHMTCGKVPDFGKKEKQKYSETDQAYNFQNFRKLSERAFSVAPNGQIEKPPVKILDLSLEQKGNVLIATRDIPKGSVIFTEKALEAIQVPSPSPKDDNLYRIKGCQSCFRSLEPASCLSSSGSLPFSELWPIPEYSNSLKEECIIVTDSGEASTMLLDPQSRRVTCPNCGTNFCNKYCAKHHLQTVGNCCQYSRALKGLVQTVVRSETERLFPDDNNEENYDEDDAESFVNINPVLVLATRMFVSQVRRHRVEIPTSDSLFHGLCGEAKDIPALGFETSPALFDGERDENDSIHRNPLQNEYEAIVDAIELTESERKSDQRFSIQEFHKLVAIAQRNSISLTTGSPFRTYYQAMVRKTGGRGSSRQQKVVAEVARLLGSNDGKLTRDMDQMVEDKVRKTEYPFPLNYFYYDM